MSVAFWAPQIWPFRVGHPNTPAASLAPACKSCPEDTVSGSAYCHEHRGDAPGYEPSDLELAAQGINVIPTDPWDSPSYYELNSVTNTAAFDAMATRIFPSTKGTTK